MASWMTTDFDFSDAQPDADHEVESAANDGGLAASRSALDMRTQDLQARVLVVSPDYEGARNNARALAACGHKVEVAIGRSDAVWKLDSGDFDAVIIDTSVPQLHELMTAARTGPVAPLIIALTSTQISSVIRADAKLHRPFDPERADELISERLASDLNESYRRVA